MKQIKTILVSQLTIDDLGRFDRNVNAALVEGWALVKREALKTHDEKNRVHVVLYAELEREKKCFNCKNIGTEACKECNDAMDKWEQGHEVQLIPVHPEKDRGARR